MKVNVFKKFIKEMLIMISAGYSKERWNIILNIRNEISFHRAMESKVVKSL